MTRALILGIPILIVSVVVQSTFFGVIQLFDQIPMLLVLCAISWGMLRGLGEGLVWGFLSGFLLDLFSVSPIGLNSIATMVAVAIAVFIVSTLPSRRFWIPAVIGGLCASVYLLFVLGISFFTPFGSRRLLMPDLGLYFFVQSIFMLPIYWTLFFLNRYFPSIEQPSGTGR